MKPSLKTKLFSMLLGSSLALCIMAPSPAVAQVDPYLGQLMLVGFGFCPAGWAEANGQLLSIASNSALFSLYGTTYGGDGFTTFALPDLRGRAPIHVGQGPGLSNYPQGQEGGAESLTLGVADMPSHNHRVRATEETANTEGPEDHFLARSQTPLISPDPLIYHDGPPDKLMDPDMITNTGSGQAIMKRSPYLTMRWCVAVTGVFPSFP